MFRNILMTRTTKELFILTAKQILIKLIIQYNDKIITNYFEIIQIITNIIWDISTKYDIDVNNSLLFQRFFTHHISNRQTFPISDITLINKVTETLQFIVKNSVHKIFHSIPNYTDFIQLNEKETLI